jgi:four helix bundle protein
VDRRTFPRRATLLRVLRWARHETCAVAAPTFQVLDVAHALVDSLWDPHAVLRLRNPSLAGQLLRAASSVPLNIAEGNRRVGEDRLHIWRQAAGSADEVRTALRVAISWRQLRAADVEPALECCDRVLAMLYRLTTVKPA